MPLASQILIIEPVNFQFNPETAEDNFFQTEQLRTDKTAEQALQEFLELKKKLQDAGIGVLSYKQDDKFDTPDSVFPNNWFSTDPSGMLIIYPMKSVNRRLERRETIINDLKKKYRIFLDLSRDEQRGLFLEGTGSLVMDHENKIAYASLSQRTSSNLLQEWGKRTGYELVIFVSYDRNGKEVYHTNVVLSIGEGFAILCRDAIEAHDDKRLVKKRLEETGHEIIEINLEQMQHFCANCLELQNPSGEKFLVMSDQAYGAFSENQKLQIGKYAGVIHSDLQTIETYGGGSARCMLAELY